MVSYKYKLERQHTYLKIKDISIIPQQRLFSVLNSSGQNVVSVFHMELLGTVSAPSQQDCLGSNNSK